METLWEDLCRVLEEECVQQERLLALCREQRDAARQGDLRGLREKTAEVEALVLQVIHAEIARERVMRNLTTKQGLGSDCKTLTEVIGVTPEPWSDRLRASQQRLRNALHELRLVIRTNAAVFRGALRIIGRTAGPIGQTPGLLERGGYDPSGVETFQGARGPSVIDQMG